MFRQHRPVYLDGAPIGCAATREQAAALVGKTPDSQAITISEESLAFRLTRCPVNTHGLSTPPLTRGP